VNHCSEASLSYKSTIISDVDLSFTCQRTLVCLYSVGRPDGLPGISRGISFGICIDFSSIGQVYIDSATTVRSDVGARNITKVPFKLFLGSRRLEPLVSSIRGNCVIPEHTIQLRVARRYCRYSGPIHRVRRRSSWFRRFGSAAKESIK